MSFPKTGGPKHDHTFGDLCRVFFNRQFSKPPDEVFKAFTDLSLRKQWFKGPTEGNELERSLDCRVGGQEVLKVKWPSGLVTNFQCTFHVVIPGQRLAYAYDLFFDETPYSTSLGDVVLKPDGRGTTLIFTEMTAYFGGADVREQNASRIHGTEKHFDGLVNLVG